jgi:phosphotransferase system HPr (HPr) family protein
MIEETLEVTNEEGLHTRPANNFVRVVRQYSSDVLLKKNGTEAPGKSLLKIMKLGIVRGDEVSLSCDGPDEKEAFDALCAVLRPEKTP